MNAVVSERTMDEEQFFLHFPRKQNDAWKGTYGKLLLINGSMGMAGAAMLNLLGAKTIGASYIIDALPAAIYPLVATRFMTPVFHLLTSENWHAEITSLMADTHVTAYGSGVTRMADKRAILDLLLQESKHPLVLDAEALRLLHHNAFVLRFARCPVILTPHIGEFHSFCAIDSHAQAHDLQADALFFAQTYHVYIVLKGPHTVVASPDGCIYKNKTGNQALAQAGSGDLLTGMIGAMLTFVPDIMTAVTMAVWAHGYLAQIGSKTHAMQNFDLSIYPQLMDQLFFKHGL